MAVEVGNPSRLPRGWIAATLGDVVKLSPERADPSENPNLQYIGLEHIESGTRRLLGTGKAGDVRSTKNVFQSGDILYGKLRPYLNKILRPAFGGVCSTDILVLRPEEHVESAFVELVLGLPRLTEFAMANSSGINLPRTNFAKLADFRFPLPPEPEQARIVRRLAALNARTNRAQNELLNTETLLDQARKSILSSALRGHLTKHWRQNRAAAEDGKVLLTKVRKEHRAHWEQAQLIATGKPGEPLKVSTGKKRYTGPEPAQTGGLFKVPSTWAWGSGAELVEPGAEIVYGIVQPGPKLSKGIPYVRGMDIENGHILVDQLMRTSPAIAKRYSRSSLRGGDVLLGIIRATKVAVVPKELDGGNITQGTARYRPSEVILTDYLAFALEAPAVQSWLHRHYRGIDMPGLNLQDVRRVPIPLPPLAEQREIVRRLKASFARLDAASVVYKAAVPELNRLNQSLLAQALQGKLVKQNPKDEPASELLARIRTGREKVERENPQQKAKKNIPPTRKPTMLLFELIQKEFGKKGFTFAELRNAADRDYDGLKGELFQLLRPANQNKHPRLLMRFHDETESMIFTLHKP